MQERSQKLQQSFTILDDGQPVQVQATITEDGIWLGDGSLVLLGWELKPEGLCRDDVCIPVRDRTNLIGPHGFKLAALATLIGRPLAIAQEAHAAYLGIAARERAAALAGLQAPDFSLPDLNGQQHTLSDYHGKKVLLVVYASW